MNNITTPAREAEVTVAEVHSAIEKSENFMLLDVRTPGEYEAGRVAGRPAPDIDIGGTGGRTGAGVRKGSGFFHGLARTPRPIHKCRSKTVVLY